MAGSASAAAGLVHAAVIGAHGDDRALVWMFAMAALAQVGLGLSLVARPSRGLAVIAGLVNVGSVVVWALTRTIGISFVASLERSEAVGLADGLCALLSGIAATAAFGSLGRRRSVAVPAVGALTLPVIAALLVLALPAMTAAPSHSHPDGAIATTHGHAGHAGHHACAGSGVKDGSQWKCRVSDGWLVSKFPFDTEPRPGDESSARAFAVAAQAEAHRYDDYNVARAAGFTFDTKDESMKAAAGTPLESEMLRTLGENGVVHLVNPTFVNDGISIDPAKPDVLVYVGQGPGTRYTLVGVMFMVPRSTDYPQPGGPLTSWHYHGGGPKQGGCVVGSAPSSFARYLPGDQLFAATGPCPSGKPVDSTPLMMHVWFDRPNLAQTFDNDMAAADVSRILASGSGFVRTS